MLWLMEGPSWDVSLVFPDIFMMALALSGSLVSGSSRAVRGPGLGLGAELGEIPHLQAE